MTLNRNLKDKFSTKPYAFNKLLKTGTASCYKQSANYGTSNKKSLLIIKCKKFAMV